MGRSVSVHSYSTAIAYSTFEPDEEYYRERFEEDVNDGILDAEEDFENWLYAQWNDEAGDQFSDYLDYVQERAQELFPSFVPCDRWQDRENHVILENAHSEISVSEYCGVVAVCLAAKFDYTGYWADDDAQRANLGKHWRETVAARFEEEFGTMNRVGGFSDGTSVYMKTA